MLQFFKLQVLLYKIGQLDFNNIAVMRPQICTDTPLVPARPPPPACLRHHTVTPCVPARPPPPACLERRTVTPSSLQQGLVVRIDSLRLSRVTSP
jgi:hypothetical protein